MRKAGQGMNWIRKEKRLAIYLRDGMACCYCGQGVEDEDVVLTLDHIKLSKDGGSNAPSNLITACHRCNTARNTRDFDEFVDSVAHYYDFDAQAIREHIIRCRRTDIDVIKAKELMAQRGGFVQACRGEREDG